GLLPVGAVMAMVANLAGTQSRTRRQIGASDVSPRFFAPNHTAVAKRRQMLCGRTPNHVHTMMNLRSSLRSTATTLTYCNARTYAVASRLS
ncbi:MAG: hypothetical protein KDB03_28670, partial [Planctomycetales bacterium]|nr:hypothetical protein [Planctomycetales bacterium]